MGARTGPSEWTTLVFSSDEPTKTDSWKAERVDVKVEPTLPALNQTRRPESFTGSCPQESHCVSSTGREFYVACLVVRVLTRLRNVAWRSSSARVLVSDPPWPAGRQGVRCRSYGR